MIRIRLSRDQARHAQEKYFPYMMMLAKFKVREAYGRDNDLALAKMLLSLLHDVHIMFAKKLLTTPDKYTFRLTVAQGICFYYFLMQVPIDNTNVYTNNLRQIMCDVLYRECIADPLEDDETCS